MQNERKNPRDSQPFYQKKSLPEDVNLNAKHAVRSWYYEDFKKVAKRLRKEGRLNERNYEKLSIKLSDKVSGLLILLIVIGVGLIYYGVNYLWFAMLVIYGFAMFIFEKRRMNRYCYLYSFGERVEGELVEVFKKQIYRSLSYAYDFTFCFRDSENQLIQTSQKDLYLNNDLDKSREVGDAVIVCYNRNNSKDAVALLSMYDSYKLLNQK